MRPVRNAGVHMRFHLLGLVLMAGVAMPAMAQRAQPLDRRVDRLEQELRAVQRRVFPGGNAQFVEPEIDAQSGPAPGGNVSGDALSNLASRVDAIEAQLRTLTGQIEESNHRSTDVEDQVTRLRAELSGRIERLEAPSRPGVQPPPALIPRSAEPPPAATPPRPAPSSP